MKILIIENDIILIGAMTRIFESLGHHVTPTTVLEDALDQITKEKFDLTTIDIRMNGKNQNGLEAYHLIRKLYGPLPVVVITGCDDEMYEDSKQFLVDPYYKVYQKPIKIDTLKEIIEFALDGVNQ